MLILLNHCMFIEVMCGHPSIRCTKYPVFDTHKANFTIIAQSPTKYGYLYGFESVSSKTMNNCDPKIIISYF